MHKYVIQLTRYTEEGAPTADVSFQYADTPQQLADKVRQYRAMRYQNEDGTTGFAMYKVEPMQAVYEKVADWEAFCNVNAVLR